MEENPLPGTHGRACYHPCESACNRQFLDQPVSIHSLDRFLGDLANEKGWTIAPGAADRQARARRRRGSGRPVVRVSPAAVRPRRRDPRRQPRARRHDALRHSRLPPAARGPDKEIARIEAMGVTIVRNYRVNDVLAEKAAGGFDAVFLAIGAQVANHLDIPAMDGGKIIDAVTLLEQVEKGRAPSLGRVVGIVGGGNTAMDAARIARRLGAEEAVLIFRSDKAQMEAHPYEAMEAFAEGVKIKWLSTVKQFGKDEIMVEQMEMLPDGSGAVGHRPVPDAQDRFTGAGGRPARRRRVPEEGAGSSHRPRQRRRSRRCTCAPAEGIFAGGDMIGGARTMTAAVGHGKKAARNIDAWLRGERLREAAAASAGPVRALNLPVFLDADRREHAELPVARTDRIRRGRRRSFRAGGALRGDALPVLRQLLRVRQLLRGLPGAGDRQAGKGAILPRRARPLHGVRDVLRTVPVSRHRRWSRSQPPRRCGRAPPPSECRRGSPSARNRWTSRRSPRMSSQARRDGRQHGRRPHRLSRQRGLRHLPDHAVVDDGGAGRRLGGPGHQEHLGPGAGHPADAVGRRRGRRRAWLAAERRADDDVHGVAGLPADAAQHVQDRRRADAVRVPCRGARHRHAGAVDLRRSLRRHERADGRLRDARRGLGAGSRTTSRWSRRRRRSNHASR